MHFKEHYPDHVMFFHYFKVGFQRLEETYVIFLHGNIDDIPAFTSKKAFISIGGIQLKG